MSWLNWFWDVLPWWVWLIPAGMAAALFWQPLLATYMALPSWARYVLGGFVAALLAYLAGRNKGRDNAREEQRRRDAQAVEKRKKSDNRIDALPESEKQRKWNEWLRDR
jgi:hypothetical protein